MSNDDTTLADDSNAFVKRDDSPDVVLPMGIEEILDMAKTPEKRARVCLRADLEAEHGDLIAELATLVTTSGEIIEDPEETLDQESTQARAQRLNRRLQEVQAEMRKAMWFPLFRGLTDDDRDVFNKAHLPKAHNANMTDYHCRLIVETCIEPVLTLDQVHKLRKKLGGAAMGELVKTALSVCVEGGVSIPKSPVSLRNLTQQ